MPIRGACGLYCISVASVVRTVYRNIAGDPEENRPLLTSERR
jgi:hypothetical protein